MKPYNLVWLVTGGIVFVAIATQSNLIKNLINKVKNPPHGFFDPVTDLQEMQQQPNFTQPLVPPTSPPLVKERYPSKIKKQYNPNESKSKSKKHNIHPTTPDENLGTDNSQYNPYVPSYQQPISPTSPTNTQFQPMQGSYTQHCKGGQNVSISPTGCYPGCISEGIRDTCRWQADLTPYYNQDYAIGATVNVGEFTGVQGENCDESGNGGGGCHPTLEITSGGPGSFSHACCGFTVRLNSEDGTMGMESEDWSHHGFKGGGTTGQVYCSDSPHNHAQACTQKGNSVTGGQPIYGQTVGIQWIKCKGKYGGAVTGPTGSFSAWAPGNPRIGILSGGKPSKDSTRIRLDSAGLNFNVLSGPQVYPNPCDTMYAQGQGYDAY